MAKYFLLFLITVSLSANAQSPRKLYQDTGCQLTIPERSRLTLPVHYDPKKRYPLLIVLPFTGGTALDYVAMMAGTPEDLVENMSSPNMVRESFFVLCPAEAGSEADHNWKGFEACIGRYEKRIMEDTRLFSTQYGIDTNRIILCGFSLGGDLSWAISQRYPEKFKGAIISGSRCSYSEKGMMARQAKSGVRYYFAMGDQEAPDRVKGLNYAVSSLKQAGVRYMNTQLEGGHVGFSMEQLKEGINFILY